MARIRTIKPEFWTSAQVMECSTNARLMFLGLWNFCDDEGRHPCSPKQIKAEIFPSDDFSSANVLGMIEELEANNLIVRYVVDGIEYLYVTGWHHQRIDKKQKAKYPPPPSNGDDPSGNDPGTFPPDTIRYDRKGMEGKGEERKGGAAAPADASLAIVGKVVRLKAEQLEQWRKSYHAIPDIVAEINKADDYYSENPPPNGKWFFAVSRWLANEHERQVKAGKTPDPMDRVFAGSR